MRTALMLALLAAIGCGGNGTTIIAAGDAAVATSSGAGGSGGGSDASAGVGASGGAGGASSSSPSSATATAASSTATAASTSGSGGAGGATSECLGAPTGTECTETCGCPPCDPAAQPGVDCAHGLCSDAETCVAYIPVNCKIGAKTYHGCNGSQNSETIIWETGMCVANSKSQVGYCAPGTPCYVNATEGVCL